MLLFCRSVEEARSVNDCHHVSIGVGIVVVEPTIDLLLSCRDGSDRQRNSNKAYSQVNIYAGTSRHRE